MSQHEQYTVPPGFSVSGGSGGATKMQPVLIDPTTSPATGDTLVWNGTLWVSQATIIRAVTVPVTSAELLDLVANPKQLLPPPGSTRWYHVFMVYYRTGTGTAYTASESSLDVVLGTDPNGVGVGSLINSAALLTGTPPKVVWSSAQAPAAALEIPSVLDQPLTLVTYNALTDGTRPIWVIVYYAINDTVV